MRRSTIALLMVLVLTGTAACAQRRPEEPAKLANVSAADSRTAQVYGAVLHRYLSTPAESSFPAGTIKVLYVMDRAFPDAASPEGPTTEGVPISNEDQASLVAALGGTVPVQFVAVRNSVIDRRDGCARVRDGGMLVTLGTLSAGTETVDVPINGFVACLGATWLTYVVRHGASGWEVTGTKGTTAVS